MSPIVAKYYVAYLATSAADAYLFLFEMGADIYAILLDKIPEFAVRQDRRMNAKSGEFEYSLKLTKPESLNKKLLAMGAVKYASVNDLDKSIPNKGIAAEKLVYEKNGIPWRGHDNIRYDLDGDITINGKKIQIKYQNAHVAEYKTIEMVAGL